MSKVYKIFLSYILFDSGKFLIILNILYFIFILFIKKTISKSRFYFYKNNISLNRYNIYIFIKYLKYIK